MEISLNAPFYWRLPPNFSGDLILSYGGYLKYTSKTYGSENDADGFDNFADVWIYGKNTKLRNKFPINDKIKLHEHFWLEGNTVVTREELMVVLQNVTKILVKASNSAYFENVT